MKTVELRTAYVWTCEECGRDNFARSVVFEFDDETRAELEEKYGDEEFDEGEWVRIPDEVECVFCLEKYKTLDYRTALDEFDDDDDYGLEVMDPESE